MVVVLSYIVPFYYVLFLCGKVALIVSRCGEVIKLRQHFFPKFRYIMFVRIPSCCCLHFFVLLLSAHGREVSVVNFLSITHCLIVRLTTLTLKVYKSQRTRPPGPFFAVICFFGLFRLHVLKVLLS